MDYRNILSHSIAELTQIYDNIETIEANFGNKRTQKQIELFEQAHRNINELYSLLINLLNTFKESDI